MGTSGFVLLLLCLIKGSEERQMCEWSNAGHREEMPLWAAWADAFILMLSVKESIRCGVQYLANILSKCQCGIWPQSTCFLMLLWNNQVAQVLCDCVIMSRPPVWSVTSSESEPEYFIYPSREAAEGKACRMCTLAQILISVTFLFFIIRFRTNRNTPGGFCQLELLPSLVSKWDH